MKKVLQKTSSSEARNPVMMWPQAQLRHSDSQPSGVPPFTVTLTMTMPLLRSDLRFGCNQRASSRQESANVAEQNMCRGWVLLQIFWCWTDWRQELKGTDHAAPLPVGNAANRSN